MITGKSILLMHKWHFLPGSIAQLKNASDEVLATIHSKEIGYHLYVEAKAVFDSLHDAQRAAEKSAGGLK